MEARGLPYKDFDHNQSSQGCHLILNNSFGDGLSCLQIHSHA